MIILFAMLAVLALGGLAAYAVSRTELLATGVPDPVRTQSAQALPEQRIDHDDVVDVRFDQALRGYRMDQVDAALSRLAEELALRDRMIEELRVGSWRTESTGLRGPDEEGNTVETWGKGR